MGEQQGGAGSWHQPEQPAPGYGPVPGYGPAPGYGQVSGYGPPPGYGPPAPAAPYASWGRRAGAYLIDILLLFACMSPSLVVAIVAGAVDEATDGMSQALDTTLFVIFLVVIFAGLLVSLFNQTWRQGQRGQSWGKQALGIYLVRERDLQPPGGGTGISRYLVRLVLGYASCNLYTLVTYLFPLWDDKKQTLDDKIVHTLVIHPKAAAGQP